MPAQHPDSPDQQSQTTPSTIAPHISRRSLLKALGAAVVTSVAATLPVPSHFALAATSSAPDDAWAIAAASPLLQLALDRLTVYQFDFRLDAASFRQVAEQPGLVGLLLRQQRSPHRRMGVDLISTVDTQQRTLRAVQAVIGWCQDCSLDIKSALLDAASLQPISTTTRAGEFETPGPHQEQQWSFPRAAADFPPPPKLDERAVDGWPPEVVSPLYWFYSGCGAVDWSGDKQPILRCTQVVEARSSQPDDTRVFELRYPAT
jgi:hypothetical protein